MTQHTTHTPRTARYTPHTTPYTVYSTHHTTHTITQYDLLKPRLRIMASAVEHVFAIAEIVEKILLYCTPQDILVSQHINHFIADIIKDSKKLSRVIFKTRAIQLPLTFYFMDLRLSTDTFGKHGYLYPSLVYSSPPAFNPFVTSPQHPIERGQRLNLSFLDKPLPPAIGSMFLTQPPMKVFIIDCMAKDEEGDSKIYTSQNWSGGVTVDDVRNDIAAHLSRCHECDVSTHKYRSLPKEAVEPESKCGSLPLYVDKTWRRKCYQIDKDESMGWQVLDLFARIQTSAVREGEETDEEQ